MLTVQSGRIVWIPSSSTSPSLPSSSANAAPPVLSPVYPYCLQLRRKRIASEKTQTAAQRCGSYVPKE